MKPLDLLECYRETILDLNADQILDLLCSRKDPWRVQSVVDECSITGISSPATTYKKIDALLAQGLVDKSVHHEDFRVKMLRPTKQGRERIKNWGKQ